MRNFFLLILSSLFLTACSHSHNIYVVRHAEKAAVDGNDMMSKDPPLTEVGKERAEALKEILKTKDIGYVFSTNTIRTRSTAEPVRSYFNLVTKTYTPSPDTAFISLLRSVKKNALVVGHSNTVDDIVNKLCGSIKIPGDLPETDYDNLFIIRKKGRKFSFENKKFGKSAP